MNPKPEDILQRFREASENFTLNPSDKVWENVNAALQKKKRKRFLIWFLTGGIILSGLTSWFIFNPGVSRLQSDIHQGNNKIIQVDSSRDETFKNKKHIENEKPVIDTETNPGNGPVGINHPSEKSIDKSSSAKNELIARDTKRKMALNISSGINIGLINDSDVLIDSMITIDALLYLNDSFPPIAEVDKKDSLEILICNPPAKWSFGIEVHALQSKFTSHETFDYNYISLYRNETDRDLISPSLNLKINYEIVPDVQLFTGLGISQYRQSILPEQMIYKSSVMIGSSPLQPVIYLRDTMRLQYKNEHITTSRTYLNIPFGLNYRIWKANKFSASLRMFAAYNHLVHLKDYRYDYKNHRYEKASINSGRKGMLSYGAGMNLQYLITKRIGIGLDLIYNDFPNEINRKGSLFQQELKSYGAGITLMYTPGK